MDNKKFYLFCIIALAIFCVGLVLENRTYRKEQSGITEALLESKRLEWQEKELQLISDSIHSAKVTDSLKMEFTNFQKRSYNEINKLNKKLKAIRLFSSDIDYTSYNDSIEKFLSNRH